MARVAAGDEEAAHKERHDDKPGMAHIPGQAPGPLQEAGRRVTQVAQIPQPAHHTTGYISRLGSAQVAAQGHRKW